jgi:hypothetical protein
MLINFFLGNQILYELHNRYFVVSSTIILINLNNCKKSFFLIDKIFNILSFFLGNNRFMKNCIKVFFIKNINIYNIFL